MSVLTRPAVLLATTAVAAGLLAAPGTAYAAGTTTQLTAAEMTAAMKSVAAASTTAGAAGWKSTTAFSAAVFGAAANETVLYDRTHGLYSDSLTVQGSGSLHLFLADGRGVYQSISAARQRSALKMMGRSSVKYTFTADKSVDVDQYGATPASLAAGYQEAGTKTANDDGSADYTFTDDGAKVTLHVSAAGALTGAHAAEGAMQVTLAYTYGRQTVTLPTSSATIASGTLAGGVAYLDMATVVQRAATAGAADTRKAAKGGTVKVANLRKIVGRDAAAANKAIAVSMVKVKSITGGVRVYATNPWTRKTVAYTVKASGKKVAVKKA
ncbi:hypothetical protein [Actinoplanes aureus]|uniref:Uncharacterized protein n=1 Tax=Actinoplanes aureus TaxID=2792083 RepID=A0A931FVT5_9ACTN|nr:hypothetical protein [Actinoplanes aureus]MBG0561117.1 hypothetical protein [Actinoplanes aureus]